MSQVVSPGEYAVRGSLIDLFPMGAVHPYRVDLLTTRSTPIRVFDPTPSAASIPCPKCSCCPAANSPWTRPPARASRPLAREAGWRPTKVRIWDLDNGIATAGIEYYLPLFFDEATVFDYLGEGSRIVLHGETEALSRFGKTPATATAAAARPRPPRAAA